MTYGIIAAKPVEAEKIGAVLENKTNESAGGIDFTVGELEGRKVILAVCGCGKVAAAMCAQTLILKYSPDCIINTGVAGTLTTELYIGDIAVSTAVVEHDMDTSAVGDPVGFITGIDVVEMPSTPELTKRVCVSAEKLGIHSVCGVIASGDQFIAEQSVKDRIVSNFGAIACEMEGAAVGHVCYVNKTPFVIIRCISDTADGSSHEDYPTFLPKAAAKSAALTIDMIKGQ